MKKGLLEGASDPIRGGTCSVAPDSALLVDHEASLHPLVKGLIRRSGFFCLLPHFQEVDQLAPF